MPIPILVSAALALATEFAPSLIRHFAGDKAGDIAQTVASTAKALTGQDITTPEGLQAAQEALRKDKELYVQFKIRSAEIDLDLEKAYLADKQSARSREVDVVKATGSKDINLYVLAWVIIGGFIGTIFGLIAIQLCTGKVLQNDPLLTLLLGSLSTNAGMVIGYFFGSSLSSSKKDNTIAASVANGK